MKSNTKISKIKNTVSILGVIYVSFYCIYLFMDKSIHSGIENVNKEITTISWDSVVVDQQVQKTKNAIQDINKARILWKDISDQHKLHLGIQIDKGTEILRKLEKKYSLPKPIQVHLTNITDATDATDLQSITHVKVKQTMVTLEVYAVTDTILYNIIEDIYDQFPGYITMKELYITRSQVDDEVIKNIKKSNDQSVMHMQLKFIWKDLESK